MTSPMHAYGHWLPPGSLVDRVSRSLPRPAATAAARTLAPPVLRTRVEMAPPGAWPPPNPDLLWSLTIAPLRFAPVSWAAPIMIVSPWAPPVVPASLVADATVPIEQPIRRRRRFKLAFAGAAIAAATAGAAALFIASL